VKRNITKPITPCQMQRDIRINIHNIPYISIDVK
jgi:hypothetical protein